LQAQLVSSVEPGYGKSHLIGRLFQALDHRASRIYVRPFQDPAASWRSILLRLVQELNRPESSGADTSEAEDVPTQLDAFVHGVISHLLAALIRQGRVEADGGAEVAEIISRDPLHAWNHSRGWLAHWEGAEFSRVLPLCVMELDRSGLVLSSASASAWLRVLFAYAQARRHDGERMLCVDWLQGEALGPEEAERIGLRPRDVPPADEKSGARNELAMRRVLDFCTLAGFYRPFLFCFDQTEVFTRDPALVGEFGNVVEALAAHGRNQLTVVTTNLEPWVTVLLPHLQTAIRARFSEPIQMQGINEEQAAVLARQRLESCGVRQEEISRFCDSAWLAAFFAEKKSYSVRDFLSECARRFSEWTARPVPQPRTLEEFFTERRDTLAAKPVEFDPDALRWAVGAEAIGDKLPGITVKAFDDPHGYFPVCWREEGRKIVFAFEESSHHLRWDAMVRAAEQIAEQDAMVRACCLRTPDQPAVPGAGWTVVGARMRNAAGFFSIRVLTREETLLVYAAYALWREVMTGDVQVARDAAFSFLRGKLGSWWEALLGAPAQKNEDAVGAAHDAG
jgi:hypothetical protein